MATKLPKQLYRRGQQGTLVYSPDIAVFVKLSNDEILDLSPYIVDFNIGRVVNDVSTFSCSIDNKFGQFDRVIKRMDRITVFLKRISWLQVFSGYVTTIPWQTVVPGNVTISAQCTMKRLAHNYFDANSTEGMELLPFRNPRSYKEADGGAASTIVRLLTKVAQWPQENINIQKIPDEWANDAAKVIDALLREDDTEMAGTAFQNELKEIKDSLLSLIDALGWTGAIDGRVLDSLSSYWSNFSASTPQEYTESAWRELVGMKPDNASAFGASPGVSGDIPGFYLFRLKSKGLEVNGNYKPGVVDATKSDQNRFMIYLRLDAADSLADLVEAWINSGKRKVDKNQDSINIPVTAAYLSFAEQRDYVSASNGGCSGTNKVEVSVTASAEARFVGKIAEDLKKAKELYKNRSASVGWPTRDYADVVDKLKKFEKDRLGLTIETKDLGMGATTEVYYWDNQEAYWLDYPDYKFQKKSSSNQLTDIVKTSVSIPEAISLKCPPGQSVLGWANSICIKPSTEFYAFAKNKLKDYGWTITSGESTDPVWQFTGNDKYPVYWDANSRVEKAGRKVTPDEYALETYTGAFLNLDEQPPEKMSNDGLKALFSVLWMGNQSPQQLSEFATGERSWLNDSSLLEVIKNICPASVRDFMSAPNGDFIAFVPDRIGRYSNFPAIQVRDIELIDFKAIASDNNLVTHYMSNADVEAAPLESLDTITQLFFTSAMMTVEQAPLMNFLLGRPIDKVDKEYGPKILQTFGIRPRVEDNKFIRNRGYNFVYALHKFQEMWANQWQFVVNLTFMPELYPGMRIELVDRTLPDGTPAPVAVYVESVSHSGSRSTGFTTTATVSTPMIKLNGKWTQYRPEFGPVDMPDTINDVVETSVYHAKLESLQQNGIIQNIL